MVARGGAEYAEWEEFCGEKGCMVLPPRSPRLRVILLLPPEYGDVFIDRFPRSDQGA